MSSFRCRYSSTKYKTVEIRLWIGVSVSNSHDIFLLFEKHIKMQFNDNLGSWELTSTTDISKCDDILLINGELQGLNINYNARLRQKGKKEVIILKIVFPCKRNVRFI